MGTNNLIRGQKGVRCANSKTFGCDGFAANGSQYCADCQTIDDEQCCVCGAVIGLPRGLVLKLKSEGKKVKCRQCLHGNGNNRELKPAAEHEPDNNPNPRRKEPKEPRIVCCTLKRKDICVAAQNGKPFNEMYRLDRKLSPGGLSPWVRGVVCEKCAESIKAYFPDAIFRTASGRPLPHHHPLGHPHHPELTYKLLHEEARPRHYLAA